MINYKNRTPESIKIEYAEYTDKEILELAAYLDKWMANKHNGRQFLKTAKEMLKDRMPPYLIARALFCHGADWFLFGN